MKLSPIRLLLLCLPTTIAAQATEIAPIPAGPFPVGTTSFERAERFASLPEERIHEFLIGAAPDLDPSEILTPAPSLQIAKIRVPDNPALYPVIAGSSLSFAYFVAYPTSPTNDRADYAFPYSRSADTTFERMQRGNQKPIFANPAEKYPTILISHGLNAHGLWEVEHAKALASHGYIAAVIFHGDGRIQQRSFQQQAARPLAVSAVLASLLAGDFKDNIDPDRIGISGTSYGGLTALAAMGGKIAGVEGLSTEKRLAAGFSVVPYVGGQFNDAPYHVFGPDNSGLASISQPFIALYATKDDVATSDYILSALTKLSGPTLAVALHGESHELSAHAYFDVRQWELLFFKAHLLHDLAALQTLQSITSFSGGIHDEKLPNLPRTNNH